MKIAVVGSGISGLTAAYRLAQTHDVWLLEAGSYLGGHTNTIEVAIAGQAHAVDTGFMVFNTKTYPRFCQLLDELQIDSQPSDMSFSVRCERSGWEFEGSSLNGLFAQRQNLLRPAFYGMLADILRFNRSAPQLLEEPDPSLTLGDYLRRERFGEPFINRYLIPMTAAIWSARAETVLDFPACFLLEFFQNHGLIQIFGRPVWRTIPGGARRYVAKIAERLGERIRLNCPVESIIRREGFVELRCRGGASERFEQVVLALHADQALSLLTDADVNERRLLGSFPFQRNEAVVHTDRSLLPRSRRAWASWNYLTPAEPGAPSAVTYDLSRLQRVNSAEPILCTLNHTEAIDPAKRLRTITYHHPVFGVESVAAKADWPLINGPRRTWFCGAYWRNGFHEDGVFSGERVASAINGLANGGEDSCRVACTKEWSGIAASAP